VSDLEKLQFEQTFLSKEEILVSGVAYIQHLSPLTEARKELLDNGPLQLIVLAWAEGDLCRFDNYRDAGKIPYSFETLGKCRSVSHESGKAFIP
jgi:hypothetical protein